MTRAPSRRASTPPTTHFHPTPAARSCRGPTPSRARFATTRASASRTPTPTSSCATSSPAHTTATSRCSSPTGDDRRDSYEHLREVFGAPCSGARPPDQPPVPLRAGHWFLANGVDAKPTTQFVVPYLTLGGRAAARKPARDRRELRVRSAVRPATSAPSAVPARPSDSGPVRCASARSSERPLGRLSRQPHLLSAWLSSNKQTFEMKDGRVVTLAEEPACSCSRDTYRPAPHGLAGSDAPRGAPHLGAGRRSSRRRRCVLRASRRARRPTSWPELDRSAEGPEGARRRSTRISGRPCEKRTSGFQLGLELYGLLPLIGSHKVGFYRPARERRPDDHDPRAALRPRSIRRR